MPVEMAIPFGLNPNCEVIMVFDPYQRAIQRIMALVGTRPSERVMDAKFGVPLDNLVFEEDDDLSEVELQDMVTTAIAKYEPGVIVQNIQPILNDDGDGVLDALVEISLTEDPFTGSTQFVNTATISTGGTVQETIRG
jgi:uncharacterized protein